jgi:ribosomal-protein-alanine N-acetyltransferase
VAAHLGPEALEACLELDQLALGGFWSRDQWRSELEQERRPCQGIWQGATLLALACGWLVVDELHITVVASHPERRRQGLGRQVLNALLAGAAAEGARHATLEVAQGNTAAQALYAAAGFRTAGIRRGYYRNGDDALIQWLRLGGAPTQP